MRTLSAEVDSLQAEVARWDDPAYVIAKARDRLVYVLPGETAYRVVDPEFVGDPAAADAGGTKQPGGTIAPQKSWFDTLWGSIEAAGTSS